MEKANTDTFCIGSFFCIKTSGEPEVFTVVSIVRLQDPSVSALHARG
jgi:hypothetical protein